MEEKADASQTFIFCPYAAGSSLPETDEKKRDGSGLAPPMTPLAKNEDKENENISRGNEAWKLEYFPVRYPLFAPNLYLGDFSYLLVFLIVGKPSTSFPTMKK